MYLLKAPPHCSSEARSKLHGSESGIADQSKTWHKHSRHRMPVLHPSHTHKGALRAHSLRDPSHRSAVMHMSSTETIPSVPATSCNVAMMSVMQNMHSADSKQCLSLNCNQIHIIPCSCLFHSCKRQATTHYVASKKANKEKLVRQHASGRSSQQVHARATCM